VSKIDFRPIGDFQRTGICPQPEQPVVEVHVVVNGRRQGLADAQRFINDGLVRGLCGVDVEDEIGRMVDYFIT